MDPQGLTGLEQTYVHFCYHSAVVGHVPTRATLDALAPGISNERRAVLDAMVQEEIAEKRERDLLEEERVFSSLNQKSRHIDLARIGSYTVKK